MEKFWVQKSSCTDVSSTLIILMIRWNSQPSLTSIFQNYNFSVYRLVHKWTSSWDHWSAWDSMNRCFTSGVNVSHLLIRSELVTGSILSAWLLTLQVGGGLLKPPKQKWQFQHFFGPIEPKKFDFSYEPIGMSPISFWGLKTAKKGVSIAFLSSSETISGS